MTPPPATESEPAALAPEPGLLDVASDGTLHGSTSGYEKFLGDLQGVYLNQAAYEAAITERGAGQLVYRVEEHRNLNGSGALIIGTSTLLPGRIGDEYAMTRGHLHARGDRAELYLCLSGNGVLLLDTLDGRSRAVPLKPGQACHVPGNWVHRSINTGDRPFVTLFCYAADAGQDYSIIEEAGGMAQIVVAHPVEGWVTRPNPRHVGYRGRQA